MKHREEFKKPGIPYATLVNGSFISRKDDPDDIELVLLTDGSALNGLSAAEKVVVQPLVDRSTSKKLFSCDAFIVPVYQTDSLRFGDFVLNSSAESLRKTCCQNCATF